MPAQPLFWRQIALQSHFSGGYIYTMILKQLFTIATFFIQNSNVKTYHEGAKDTLEAYESMWTIALKRELFRAEELKKIVVQPK